MSFESGNWGIQYDCDTSLKQDQVMVIGSIKIKKNKKVTIKTQVVVEPTEDQVMILLHVIGVTLSWTSNSPR